MNKNDDAPMDPVFKLGFDELDAMDSRARAKVLETLTPAEAFTALARACVKGDMTLEAMEQGILNATLAENPNRSEAARLLGIGRSTLYRRIEENTPPALVPTT